MRSHRSRPLRRTQTSQPTRRIAIFTEGKKTEPGYFDHWHREYRQQVQLDIRGGLGAPLTVVEHAVKRKRHEARESRRGRGRASDEYWCVFDVDQHPNIDAAIQKAQANGIEVALSNPCIELWFVLHFQDQAAHIERAAVQAASRQLLDCDKLLDRNALQELERRVTDARRRAQALDDKHEGDGRAPGSNPSSGLWRLIDRIMG